MFLDVIKIWKLESAQEKILNFSKEEKEDLIQLHVLLNSFFVKIEDQINWVNQDNGLFEHSVKYLIVNHPERIKEIKEKIVRLLNP